MKIRSIIKLMLVTLAGLTLIEGYCLKCGTRRIGWALLYPQHQTCPKCGAGLKITRNGRPIAAGYSPFQAEKYIIKSPNGDTKSDGQDKDAGIKKDKQ